MNISRVVFAGISLALSVLTAHSQTGVSGEGRTSANDQGSVPPEEASAQVVVQGFRAETATKTDTALAQIPQAISIVTADELEGRGAIGLQEGLRYLAGLRTEPNGTDSRFDYFLSRGFSATRYLDGLIRIDGYETVRTDIYSLDHVEVLRGPSSVLYGQGTAGGIVNAISKRPDGQARIEVGAEYGSFNRKQLEFDAKGPLTDSGSLSGRLIGLYRNSGSQFQFGRDDRVLLTPSLRFQPDDGTDLLISAQYQKDRQGSWWPYVPVSASLLAPPGRRLPDNVFLGEPGLNHYDREEYYAQALLQHRFNNWLSYGGGVRFTHAYANDAGIYPDIWNGYVNPFLDANLTTIPRYRYDQRAYTNSLASDNRLQAEFGTGPVEHTVLVGADYSRTVLDSASVYLTGAPPIDIYAPTYGNILPAQLDPYVKQHSSQLGVYVQDQILVRNILALLVGARHDRASETTLGSESQVNRVTTTRAGLSLEVFENVTPYMSYSKSFIPTVGLNFFNQPFKPQFGIQYEAGVKWQPDSHTLLTLALFNLTGTNLPETDPSNGQNTLQVGSVRSRGGEVEIVRRLPDNYSVSLSVSHLKMRTISSDNPMQNGQPISGVPANEASVWGEKTFPLGAQMSMHMGLGVRYVGASEEADSMQGSIVSLVTPGFTLVDGMLGIDRDPWKLTLKVTNLLDKRYYALCSPQTACGIGYRRNIIGQWTYRFQPGMK
ncbi:MAG: TonB-dependent siderophore receptor [Proteobacteria bacterium]|nr:TonB-dependent siderophore receptor [Pseudomonadota bacterium]